MLFEVKTVFTVLERSLSLIVLESDSCDRVAVGRRFEVVTSVSSNKVVLDVESRF